MNDIARSWYQNSSDEELLNLTYGAFTKSLIRDRVDPDITDDAWWELQEYIDRNIRGSRGTDAPDTAWRPATMSAVLDMAERSLAWANPVTDGSRGV